MRLFPRVDPQASGRGYGPVQGRRLRHRRCLRACTAQEFSRLCRRLRITQSMDQVGSCSICSDGVVLLLTGA